MAEVENIILSLLEKEIPEGRKALRDGNENLDKVALYCHQKYQETNIKYKGAPDKAKVREETREVLNETKQYATQSLASVAYQINTLAVNMLNLLDQQAFQLQTMESNINHISEIVNIHKEKVARREIGVLATSKNTTRTHKIIAPAKQEKPERYSRKPVDYSILDDVGHGVKISQSDRRQSRTSSAKKKQTAPSPTQSANLRNKPGTRGNIKPPPPPVPPPMPPSLPEGADTYASIGDTDQAIPPPPPPTPVVTPSKVVVQPPMAPPPPPMVGGPSPPPPPPFPTTPNLPPPESHGGDTYEAVDDMMSPPPPPPPPEDFYNTPSSLPMPAPPEEGWYDTAPPISSPQMPAPPPPMMGGSAPDEYIEKVIALYDYTAMRDDELTFTENTIIYVVKKNDDGWFEGVTEETGQTGLFPGNYVQPV